MLSMAIYSFIIMLMMMLLLHMPFILSITMKKWSEKISSFECGMNLNSTTRKPFSLQFFLLMMLFIIFDAEIALIMATPLLMPYTTQMMLFLFFFMIILLMGIMYEWKDGSLNWKT